MNERVDQVLESCIEVESNRRLLDENLNYLTLTFKDSKMERNVSKKVFRLELSRCGRLVGCYSMKGRLKKLFLRIRTLKEIQTD